MPEITRRITFRNTTRRLYYSGNLDACKLPQPSIETNFIMELFLEQKLYTSKSSSKINHAGLQLKRVYYASNLCE